jgi:hypothetical protein
VNRSILFGSVRSRILFLTTVLTLFLNPAFAAVGDLVHTIDLPVVGGGGSSVAVDCDGNLYYTNRIWTNGNTLYKIDKDGELLHQTPIREPDESPVTIIVMDWDQGRQILWGAGKTWPGPPSGWWDWIIYRLDPSTGVAEPVYNLGSG